MNSRAPHRLTQVLNVSLLAFLLLAAHVSRSDAQEKSVPQFKEGEAQIVEGFKNPKDWITHDLWVETDFDSDQDGSPDRMHVSVTRQKQTETEGLKVPVVYVTSPLFCGCEFNF